MKKCIPDCARWQAKNIQPILERTLKTTQFQHRFLFVAKFSRVLQTTTIEVLVLWCAAANVIEVRAVGKEVAMTTAIVSNVTDAKCDDFPQQLAEDPHLILFYHNPVVDLQSVAFSVLR